MCYFHIITQAYQTKSTQNISSFPNSYPSEVGSGFNVIDSCWRKDSKWASNRQKLADCAKGYGADARGGKNGAIYVVTDPSDHPIHPKKGTLRYGAIQKRPLWIIFKRDMSITLEGGELFISSYKTIDGRGARVEIANGPCLRLDNVSHVIIHGITIHNCLRGRLDLVRRDPDHLVNTSTIGQSDGDGIRVTSSSKIWIDHCYLSKCGDGLLDITQGSAAVTVSNNYFTQHNKVMLLGHSNMYLKDKKMHVTVVFNHFASGLGQRMPRVRYGYAHVANNKYDEWGFYAIGGSSHPTILSEGNHYTARNDPRTKEVTKRISHDRRRWKKWSWKSKNDLFFNGAYFVSSGKFWRPNYSRSQAFKVASAKGVPTSLTRDAGPLRCVENLPCRN
ncbi:probable pectate lyase 4 [Coffea arabica]|uniref:Pectate lyase n=1 Tax=Coffea arabica TaxID=13443 RepID=A0A6P6UC88_COFAR|nr:probable pectate lyase 4 [Coffea arabica]